MNTITVIKLNIQGEETWRYQGRLIKQKPHEMVIEAFFDREDTPVDRMMLQRGDRFVEYYYDHRWFNIFEVFDKEARSRKGWYCNICFPAQFTDRAIIYHDLALDLVVYPDGNQTILDRDEFEALHLKDDLRKMALSALDELMTIFKKPPENGPGLEISFELND